MPCPQRWMRGREPSLGTFLKEFKQRGWVIIYKYIN